MVSTMVEEGPTSMVQRPAPKTQITLQKVQVKTPSPVPIPTQVKIEAPANTIKPQALV